MKSEIAITLVILSGMLWSSCSAQQALWIDVKGEGEHKTIAVSEGIARRLIDTKHMNIKFSKRERTELITREQIRSVLDERERLVTTSDDGKTVTMCMKSVATPGKNNDKSRLVLEVYKKGKQTFKFTLPQFEIESIDDDNEFSVHGDLNWKEWVPFLAKEGGAVFIKDYDDDSEVWVYVD